MPTYNNGAGYFLYVRDISEVYNYNVPQGNTMFFMNKDKPVFYIKAVDMFNQQTVRTYDLVEQIQTAPNPTVSVPQQTTTSPYVTRDELSSIISDAVRTELREHRNKSKKEEA